MTDFSATIDTAEVEEFTRALPREIFNATRSAVRTTTTFAEKELEKRMAAASKIPLKAFKVYRVHSKAGDDAGTVWFGFKPIKAKYLGAMSESGSGAEAGSYFFQGGFVARMQNGNENIFKRKGKARFPIQTQFANLPQSELVISAVADIAQEELLTRFTKKLNGYIEKRESAA
jgi:hypothetical protein